jgi:AcrR family transcriptional regulator
MSARARRRERDRGAPARRCLEALRHAPYEQVRLREIAAEAEVTVQTLHLRFHSKDELLSTAYAWFGQQEIARRPPAPAADVLQALTLLFDRYEEHGQAVLRMLSQEERIPAIKRMTDAGRAYHRHWVQTTFEPQLHGSPENATSTDWPRSCSPRTCSHGSYCAKTCNSTARPPNESSRR